MKHALILVAAVVVMGLGSDDFKRERSGKGDDVKNAAEGKAIPDFKAEKWMNTEKNEALNLAKMKGKVIVLDFWAHW